MDRGIMYNNYSFIIYSSFSILYFTCACALNFNNIRIILFLFFLLTLLIQLGINWSAIPKDAGRYGGYAFGYTLMNWIFILGLTSIILIIMPGWVRVFSNTIGWAISKSWYYVEIEKMTKMSLQNDDETIKKIYSDPSKIINELGVESAYDYNTWKSTIYEKVSRFPFFNNVKFNKDAPYDDKDPQKQNDNLLYQLYLIVQLKEKIGYFIWIFLIGLITVLASLNNVLSLN